MDRRLFLKTTGLVAAAATSVLNGATAEESTAEPTAAKTPAIVNPFSLEGKWYKAALHVHTTTSDGDVEVAVRLSQYRELGYDVVAVTDHWKTNDVSAFTDEKFLVINSMEAHPQTASGAPAHHLVCLDLPHPFELDKKLPAQELVDKVINAGGKVIYAHPYWTTHTPVEMAEIKGYIGIEVYNAVCHIEAAKGFGNVHWDQLLNKGQILPAVATDDVHSSKNINLGWTMIKAQGLTKPQIMDAITKGSCYASSGPVIEDLKLENGTISVVCSPVEKIRFLFAGTGGGRTFKAEPGQTITTASWQYSSNKRSCKWLRAEVIDAKGNYAWTNPLEC